MSINVLLSLSKQLSVRLTKLSKSRKDTFTHVCVTSRQVLQTALASVLAHDAVEADAHANGESATTRLGAGATGRPAGELWTGLGAAESLLVRHALASDVTRYAVHAHARSTLHTLTTGDRTLGPVAERCPDRTVL